MNEITNERQK